MPELPSIASFVVGLHINVIEPSALYRIEATVQLKFVNALIYEERVEYFNTWADVVTWLGALLSSTAATTTVADHLLSLRSV